MAAQHDVQKVSDDARSAVEDALGALRAGGHRVTGARRAVIEALAATSGHPSAEQLCTWVAERYPAVHRATVYRTLERLTALGVITHVHIGGSAMTYHLAASNGSDHLHASCRACGQVIDLPDDLLESVRERVERDADFRLEPAHVALSGMCSSCRVGP